MSWYELYSIIEPYLVRIKSQEGFGTGFLFAYNEEKTIAAIATASHVVYHADYWRLPIRLIHQTTGKEIFLKYEDRVIMVDHKRDSAAIAIKAKELELPDETLPLLAADKYKKVGIEVGWVGYPALAPTELCFFQGRISAFTVDDDSYLIDGVAINGVSGGPIFAEAYDKPEMIGMVSAYIANLQQGNTLPGLLKAHDLTHLHNIIASMKSLYEARKKEEKVRQEKKHNEHSDRPTRPSEPTPPSEPTAPSEPTPPTEPPRPE